MVFYDPAFAVSSIDLELTTRCPFHCSICPRSHLPNGEWEFPFPLFARLTPFFLRHFARITLSGMGTPVCHPCWERFITHYRKRGGVIGLTIHAATLVPAITATIHKVKPSFLEISLPSASPQGFQALCPGLEYGETLDRLRAFLAEKPPCPTALVAVQTDANPQEKDRILELASRFNVTARVYPLHHRAGYLAAGQPPESGLPTVRCGLFAMQTFIAADGCVYPCVHDVERRHPLVDLKKDPPQKLLEIKHRFSVDPDASPFTRLCRKCDDQRRNLSIPDRPFPPTRRAWGGFMKDYLQRNARRLQL
ncbi:MAG: hypothetical protein D6820_00725 [Lentisphaerae bacterium]|nr:MAG: hypothetical protein D6820_00725 [Lentisphaerota bacterium]